MEHPSEKLAELLQAAGMAVPLNATRDQLDRLVATFVGTVPNQNEGQEQDFVSIGDHDDEDKQTNDLDEELVRLEKKKRILQLRKDIAELECASETTNPKHRIEFTDIQHAIVPFTGDTAYNIKKWIADFERIMDSASADMRTRLLFARRLMSGSATLLLITVKADTWIELKKQLVDEFDRKVDRQDVYF